jgi:hypothetical protein
MNKMEIEWNKLWDRRRAAESAYHRACDRGKNKLARVISGTSTPATLQVAMRTMEEKLKELNSNHDELARLAKKV